MVIVSLNKLVLVSILVDLKPAIHKTDRQPYDVALFRELDICDALLTLQYY